MSTRKSKKQTLLNELNEIIKLPGNWDGEGATPVSSRATGNYRAFLDTAPYIREDFLPIALNNGGVLVEWVAYLGRKQANMFIEFFPDGRVSFGSEQNSSPALDRFDSERVEQFLLATS